MVTVSTGVSEELVVRAYQSGIYEHIQLPLYDSILQHKIALSLDIPPSVNVNVYGDSNRLKQILANLLNNAIKYTREGDISISIDCLKESESFAQLKFSVKDTGICIRNEQLETIFEAFKQWVSLHKGT